MFQLCFAVLALSLGCSRNQPSPPPPEITPRANPSAAKPAVFPTEVPSLATAEALQFLPDDTEEVGVASSLDALAAELTDAPLFETVTGLAPSGLSRTRPIGIALVAGRDDRDNGWLAFAYVDDVKAFEASVPAARRARRGELVFVADSPATLRDLRPAVGAKQRRPDLGTNKSFHMSVDKLHLGALVSWWHGSRGAAGISVDGATLYFRAVDGLPRTFGVHDYPVTTFSIADLVADDAPASLLAKRDSATTELEQLDAKLAIVRNDVVAEIVKQLGLGSSVPPPVERTFSAPAPSVKAWLAPLVDRWRAAPLQAKVDSARKRVAALNGQIQLATRAALEHSVPARSLELDLSQPTAAPRNHHDSGDARFIRSQ